MIDLPSNRREHLADGQQLHLSCISKNQVSEMNFGRTRKLLQTHDWQTILATAQVLVSILKSTSFAVLLVIAVRSVSTDQCMRSVTRA
jgi:hypothetical protein